MPSYSFEDFGNATVWASSQRQQHDLERNAPDFLAKPRLLSCFHLQDGYLPYFCPGAVRVAEVIHTVVASPF